MFGLILEILFLRLRECLYVYVFVVWVELTSRYVVVELFFLVNDENFVELFDQMKFYLKQFRSHIQTIKSCVIASEQIVDFISTCPERHKLKNNQLD